MDTPLLNDSDLHFLLYEFLDTEALLARPRYCEHSREVFDATLNTAKTIAEKYFANHNAKGDAHEPQFDGEKVSLIPETQAAWNAFAEAGFLAAHHDFDDGGLQMPEVILRTAMAYFTAANIATAGYGFLTIGAANLIHTFGSPEQKARFLPAMLDGRASGTMALTEPGQGSALADIKTSATPADDGSYRIRGNKMYISGGDHSLTENIIHLVLAKIAGAPAGAGGISLFIVPKFLVNDDGTLGARNDVALAGLLHKMGFRNTTSTVLNFGERDGAIGYLVGEPHQGLRYMFQMMNEARIGVGAGAAILGYQGFNYSLNYARQRPQGRLPSSRDATSPQVNIIEHADVRRLLLSQKAYAEGGLALCLYASSLVEDARTGATETARTNAFTLLDLITPVVKSWPSKYGLKANDNAIQVLGGAGYIREYPVEQYFRDNRLNPIHEGTEGIQGLDLLGRKVPQKNMAGYQLLRAAINATLDDARPFDSAHALAQTLATHLHAFDQTTQQLMARLAQTPDATLANATVYLDVFGRVLVSWLWLKQAVIASRQLDQHRTDLPDVEINFYRGKLQAARYYIEWELPEIMPQLALLDGANSRCFDMQDAWF
ncbi:acyl-CoA dehydrogenase [Simiduia aestuariiviva]|uniref:Butyryl-CoA dehydrogenase n=1 Tax=Simiduia aestuariiviva TaxID=1510459 RepID=A0A839USL8_9GAMM|nr:acyl-CoA dehydrogenase [Simiduia aestuariiviva]MBB3169460.1 butyryl-CoA dehydrogenase [Simiduia aestuariiviva]